ncbi:hypothetical protein KW797_02310 [Candidatus Parcubacteria bacterium]|nr:hypothetical protein [Candidatus Parcubacteria bacterium]
MKVPLISVVGPDGTYVPWFRASWVSSLRERDLLTIDGVSYEVLGRHLQLSQVARGTHTILENGERPSLTVVLKKLPTGFFQDYWRDRATRKS